MAEVKPLPGDYSSMIDMYEPSKTGTFGVVVYGASGSGKTTFASTFPDPFFIDADRGMRSLSGAYPRIRLKDVPKPFTFVLQILQDAAAKRGPWAPGGKLADKKTIIIDSITSLVDDYLMPEALREDNRNVYSDKASYDEYGKIKTRMTALASVIKDLTLHYWVVVTALVEEEKDEVTGAMVGKPLITGKYRDKIMADYDETYYINCQRNPQTGQLKFVLYPQPYLWYKAKTRLLKPVSSIEDPTYQKLVDNFKLK